MNKSMFGMIMIGIGLPLLIFTGMVFFSFPGPYGNVLGIGAFNHTLLLIVSVVFLVAGIISTVLAERDEKRERKAVNR